MHPSQGQDISSGMKSSLKIQIINNLMKGIEGKFTKEAVISVAVDNFGVVHQEAITNLYDFLCDEIWRFLSSKMLTSSKSHQRQC